MEITCLTLTLMFILVGADRIRILSKGSIMLSCDDRDEKFEENRNLLVSSSIELFFFGLLLPRCVEISTYIIITKVPDR